MIHYDVGDDHVARITLDRPDAKNALTIDMRAAIGTQPVPLHPGAENWFRAARNT